MKRLIACSFAALAFAGPAPAKADDTSARDQAVFVFGEDSKVVSAIDWVNGKRDDLLGRIEEVRSGWTATSDPKRLNYRLTEDEAACVADQRQCHSSYENLRKSLSDGMEKKGVLDSVKEQYEKAKEAVSNAYDDLTLSDDVPNGYQRSAMLGARLAEAEAGQGDASALAEEYSFVEPGRLGDASASDMVSDYEWRSSGVPVQDADVLYGMPSGSHVEIVEKASRGQTRIARTDDGTGWEVYDYQGDPVTEDAVGEYRAATPRYAEQTVDTYGTVPGGVACVSPSLPMVKADGGVIFKDTGKIRLPDAGLEASLPVSASDFLDLMSAMRRDRRLAVTLAGDGSRIGDLPLSSRMTERLLEADSLMGSLVFDGSSSPFAYRFDIGDLKPSRGSFSGVVFFEITHNGFDISDGKIVSKGQTVNVTLVPMTRGDGGELVPDYVAFDEDGFKPESGLAERVRKVAANMKKLAADPLLAPAFQVCEGAALARMLVEGNLEADRVVVTGQE